MSEDGRLIIDEDYIFTEIPIKLENVFKKCEVFNLENQDIEILNNLIRLNNIKDIENFFYKFELINGKFYCFYIFEYSVISHY